MAPPPSPSPTKKPNATPGAKEANSVSSGQASRAMASRHKGGTFQAAFPPRPPVVQPFQHRPATPLSELGKAAASAAEVQPVCQQSQRFRTSPKRAPARPPRPPLTNPKLHHFGNLSPQQLVETMFRNVMIASQSDLESQIEALLPGSDPDVHVKDGLTLFTQYVYFRLQYWYNKYPHRWPIANHECLQSIQARRSFTRK